MNEKDTARLRVIQQQLGDPTLPSMKLEELRAMQRQLLGAMGQQEVPAGVANRLASLEARVAGIEGALARAIAETPKKKATRKKKTGDVTVDVGNSLDASSQAEVVKSTDDDPAS